MDFVAKIDLDNQKYVPKGKGLLVLEVSEAYREQVKKSLINIQKQGGGKVLSWKASNPEKALKTSSQNNFFWSIYQLMADIQNAGTHGPDPVKTRDLFEADVRELGVKYFPVTIPKKELAIARQECYIFEDEIEELGGGMVFVHRYKRFSKYEKKEAMCWIDTLLQRIGSMDIPKNLEAKAMKKWHEFQIMANSSGWIRSEGQEMSQKEYKQSVKVCEMCGGPIYENGSLAHIVARGMGGNEEKWKESPENWLHLHDKCHALLDNGPGLKEVLERFPHLKNKIENAHTLGAKGE